MFQNSNSVEQPGESRERWLAHHLAAALIRVQTGSDLLPAPPTFDEVADKVERIEGVHFRDLPARYRFEQCQTARDGRY